MLKEGEVEDFEALEVRIPALVDPAFHFLPLNPLARPSSHPTCLVQPYRLAGIAPPGLADPASRPQSADSSDSHPSCSTISSFPRPNPNQPGSSNQFVVRK